MNTKPWDASGSARNALHGIVSDPQYGATALSQPAVMTNLLKDMLPDEPREAGLLVAAAQADLAGSLRGYLAQGLDPDTAVSLTATSFVNSTSHTPEAGNWVVAELALALGLKAPAARFDQPTAQPAPPPTALAAPPPPPLAQPGQQAWPVAQNPVAQNAAFNSPAAPPPYQPVAPNPWQPTPWAVPPPRPASSGRGLSILGGLAGLLGAFLVFLGCLVPYEKGYAPGQPGFGILLGHRGYPASFTFWFAAEPFGVLLVAIVAGIALMASSGSGRLRGLLPGMFLAFGFQTTLLFAGVAFTVIPASNREAGGLIGILGGLVLLAAGVFGMISRARPDAASPSAPSTPAVPGATVPGPRPAGT